MNRAVLGTLAAWVLAAGMTFCLEPALSAAVPAGASADPVQRLAGGVTEALGDTIFIKADEYYHGGAEEHENETEEELAREGHVAAAPEARDWVAAVNGRVREHSHFHLGKDKQKEMLPLLGMALRLDPHNVEAVLTTAYWLERQLGKADEARKVLRQGAVDNPGSWEIAYRLGHLIVRKWKDRAAALPWYEASIRNMDASPDVPDYMRRNAWYSLGECYESAGDGVRAKQAYRTALKYFKPGDPEGLKKAIDEKLGAAS